MQKEAIHTWVFASQNSGKLKEFNRAFESLAINLKPLSEWSDDSPVETGLSFVENALIKARHASRLTGLPALADDSGLCVTALKGAPGIYSARFAGEDASDADNMRALLEKMHAHPETARDAHFVCALAWVEYPKDPVPVLAMGHWYGQLLTAPTGDQGFGYDPIFWVPETQCSAAELTSTQKQALSHRGKAVRQLLHSLQQRLQFPSNTFPVSHPFTASHLSTE